MIYPPSNVQLYNFNALVKILAYTFIPLQGFLFMIPDFCHKFIPGFRGGVQEGAISPAGKTIFIISSNKNKGKMNASKQLSANSACF